MPNLIPIWVNPNNKVRQLIQMSNLINLNLIGKMIMTLWQLVVIGHQNVGKNVGRQIVEMKNLFFLQVQ